MEIPLWLACIKLFSPSLVIVDAASMRTSGQQICSTLRQADEKLPIILIVDNDHFENHKGNTNNVLTWPFTHQKLVTGYGLIYR